MPRRPSQRLLVVTALLRDRDGRVLLVQRGRGSRAYQRHWQFPEGKMELGEAPLAALRRELKEELALRLRRARLIGTTHTVGEHSGECLEIVRLVYYADAVGAVRLGDGHAAYRWLQPSRLARLQRLVPGTQAVMTLISKNEPHKEITREVRALYRTVRRRQVRHGNRARAPVTRPRRF